MSFSAIFIRLAEAPGLTIALYRNVFAGAVVAVLMAARRREELRGVTGPQLRIAVLSGLLLALHFATWIPSLELTTVAASVTLVTASPIVVAALGRLLFGERVSRRTLVGVVVGMAGAALISGGDVAVSARAAAGDALAFAGAVAAAGYFVAGRRLRRDLSLTTYVGIVYSVCAVALLVVALVARVPLAGFDARTWVMFLLLALVSQLFGHTAFNHLLKDVDATVVAVAVMGEPVGSTLLALMFFGEVPPWTAVVGGCLVLVGIYVATVRSRGDVEASPVG